MVGFIFTTLVITFKSFGYLVCISIRHMQTSKQVDNYANLLFSFFSNLWKKTIMFALVHL